VSAGQIRRLVINVAPRSMKSLETCVFWPTWDWISRPWSQWVFGSYAQRLAVRDTVKARRVIDSPWYQERWGCTCDETPHAESCTGFRWAQDQNTKSLYENDRGGRRQAVAFVPGPLGDGGDVLVIDDPLNPKQVASENVLESALAAWDETWLGRQNNPRTSAIVVIMQRLHERDLTGHVLEAGGYEHLCIPTEYEVPPQVQVTGIGFTDPREEPGELMWPGRVGPAEVEEEKKRGSFVFSGQHQQRPTPGEGGTWHKDWWCFWYPPGLATPPAPWRTRMPDGTLHTHAQMELPARFDEQLNSWDMAFKSTKASSYVVGQTWARRAALKFLLDQVRDRLEFVETVRAVRDLAGRWPRATAHLVEDKANGPAVLSTLRGVIAGMIPIEPDGSKEARAASVSPTIEAGDVHLPHPALYPWVQEFLAEAAGFPNSRTKDQVDTASQALRRFQAVPPPAAAVKSEQQTHADYGQLRGRYNSAGSARIFGRNGR
jgi:predicted phage terminase large subunit-like protein